MAVVAYGVESHQTPCVLDHESGNNSGMTPIALQKGLPDDVLHPCLSFRLPIATPLLNTTQRQHWGKRRKSTIQLAGWVRLLTQGRRPREPFQFARIDVVRYSKGTPDYDNMVGGVKALLDCFQPPGEPFKTGQVGGPYKWTCKYPYGLGIIQHDGPGCIHLHVTSVKVASSTDQGTLVTITSLPASPLTPASPRTSIPPLTPGAKPMPLNPDYLLSTQEVATRLRISVWTVIDWRRSNRRGVELPFVKIGRRVFYRTGDVERLATMTVCQVNSRPPTEDQDSAPVATAA